MSSSFLVWATGLMVVGAAETDPKGVAMSWGGRGCRERRHKFEFEGFELVMSVGLPKSKGPHYFTHILTCFLCLPWA